MSDIQRFVADNGELVKFEDANGILTWRTVVVTYADHLAAVAAAEQRVLSDVDAEAMRQNVAFRKGVKAAREAVARQKVKWSIDYDTAIDDALAAIDALLKEKP